MGALEFIRAAGVTLFIRVLGALSGLLLTIVVTQHLSVAQAGYFLLSVTIVFVASYVGGMGLDSTLLRFSSALLAEKRYAENWGLIVKGVVWAGGTLAAITVVLYFLSSRVTNFLLGAGDFSVGFQFMSLSIFFYGITILVASLLQARAHIVYSILVLNVLIPMISALCIWYLRADTPEFVAKIYFVVCVLVCLFSALMLLVGFCPLPTYVSFSSETLWRSCQPIWVVTLMAQLTQFGSPLISAVWLGAEEVALLSVSQRVSMLVAFVLIAANFVLAPRFSILFSKGSVLAAHRLAFMATMLMSLVVLPVMLVVFVFAEGILGYFGTDYVAAKDLLFVFVCSQAITVMTGPTGYMLTMSGHERDMRMVVCLSAGVAVLLPVVLTPIYGLWGAVIASVVANVVQQLAALLMVRKRFSVKLVDMMSWKKGLES